MRYAYQEYLPNFGYRNCDAHSRFVSDAYESARRGSFIIQTPIIYKYVVAWNMNFGPNYKCLRPISMV